jgi:hypothetical protein
VIAEVGALKGAARDLAELDCAEENLVCPSAEEKANEVWATTPGEVSRELDACPGRRDPRVVKRAAPPVQSEHLGLIRAAREGEVDSGTVPRGARDFLPRHLSESVIVSA